MFSPISRYGLLSTSNTVIYASQCPKLSSAIVAAGSTNSVQTHAHAHNLYSFEPLNASLQTHTADVEMGAHLEYLALLTTRPAGPIFARVRNVVEAAKHTADNTFQTADGKNIGTITAYFDGTNVCPNQVGDAASY
jgi:hypothetical protein